MPFCLMGVLGIYAVYLVTARFVSRRAGVLAAVVVATAPMYSLVARQAMTDMAFVGPDGDGAGAGRDGAVRRRGRRLPRRGRGAPDAGRTTGCSTARSALFALTTHPAADRSIRSAEGRDPVGRRRAQDVRRVAMIPYYLGFAALRVPGGAHALQGAAVPVHRRHPVRPGGAGQGAGRAGAAADRLRRLPGVHLELAPAAARAAAVRRGGVAGRAARSWRCPGTTP